MDPYLKSLVLDIYSDQVRDDADLAEYDRALGAMWQDCLERRAFGYRAHYEAIVPTLPDIFRRLKPLVKDTGQFGRLCRAIPAIVRWLPYTSEEGPWDYTHDIILGPFLSRVESSQTLDEFIKAFEVYPVTACRDCGKDLSVERHGKSATLRCTCGFFMIA